MTTAPAAAAMGLHSRDTLAGVLERTMSTPENSSAGEHADRMRLASEDNGLACAPGRCQEFDLCHRKGPFFEKSDQQLPDRATGTDHRNVLHR